MSEAIVELRDVYLAFDRPILEGVSFAAQKGETVRIAFMDPLSGPFANVGQNQLKSWQFVADRLHFTAEQTVACGDGENDRELLDWAGFGVAVANAHEEILARADLVVPDVEHEGIAVLLETFVDSLA